VVTYSTNDGHGESKNKENKLKKRGETILKIYKANFRPFHTTLKAEPSLEDKDIQLNQTETQHPLVFLGCSIFLSTVIKQGWPMI